MSNSIKDEDRLTIIRECVRILSKGIEPGDSWDDPELEKWLEYAGMDCEDHIHVRVEELLGDIGEDEIYNLSQNMAEDLWEVWHQKRDELIISGSDDELNDIISMAEISIDLKDLPQ